MFVIDVCGPEYAKRYFLKDCAGRFWSDMLQDWTTNFNEAGLYADGGEVCERMHDLMLSLVPGEVRTFVAPVVIEVKSQEPVEVEALQDWLDKAVQVFMDAKHGVGPENCMVMLQINWSNIKGASNEPNT